MKDFKTCWICKFQKITKSDWTSHKDLDKALREFFEPKYKYNQQFSESGYYETKKQ